METGKSTTYVKLFTTIAVCAIYSNFSRNSALCLQCIYIVTICGGLRVTGSGLDDRIY
jgi:hypothetical protein